MERAGRGMWDCKCLGLIVGQVMVVANDGRGGQRLTGRSLRRECSWRGIGPEDWGLGRILPVVGARVLGWIGVVGLGAESADGDEFPLVKTGITSGMYTFGFSSGATQGSLGSSRVPSDLLFGRCLLDQRDGASWPVVPVSCDQSKFWRVPY